MNAWGGLHLLTHPTHIPAIRPLPPPPSQVPSKVAEWDGDYGVGKEPVIANLELELPAGKGGKGAAPAAAAKPPPAAAAAAAGAPLQTPRGGAPLETPRGRGGSRQPAPEPEPPPPAKPEPQAALYELRVRVS